jgi:hypothetical protein
LPSICGRRDLRGSDDLRFCLDANLSHKVARALRLVELPFAHVADVFGGAVTGQSPVEDEVIARWCGTGGHVLVTIDGDFRARWVRSGLLATHDVEVIVFHRDILGLAEQHRRVTLAYEGWVQALCRHDAGHRVWEQRARGSPTLMRRRPSGPSQS